ncbi:MAG: hypothetical protein KC549_13750 [Myxococcales bacterium]|nr:hypothetical protein [Myxococcales bacterium]
MPLQSIEVKTLVGAGFSKPAQASSYYPGGARETHLHLGTPTQAEGLTAGKGAVLVTFIAVKVEGRHLGNLRRRPDGLFEQAPPGTPEDFVSTLAGLGLLAEDAPREAAVAEDEAEVRSRKSLDPAPATPAAAPPTQRAVGPAYEKEDSPTHQRLEPLPAPPAPALPGDGHVGQPRPLPVHEPTRDAAFAARPSSQETQAMATPYSIDISMSQSTVAALVNGGFKLYAFKGVQTTMGGGAPVVWFESTAFSLTTTISWEEQYQAYTSTSAIIPSGRIVASAAYDADLGQELTVTSSAGTGTVGNGATDGAISILNATTTPFTCGISQVVNNQASPLCAFPLFGNNLDVMAPIEKVLLMFATDSINTGTVIYKAYSQGVLVDLTGATDRDVSYDMNTGWAWGGFSWGQAVAPNKDLVPLLIDSSSSLAKKRLRSLHA